MGKKIPSPCVGFCKFTLEGHCLGCGMSKKQKQLFKELSGRDDRTQCIAALIEQQERLDLRANWLRSYRQKNVRKGPLIVRWSADRSFGPGRRVRHGETARPLPREQR